MKGNKIIIIFKSWGFLGPENKNLYPLPPQSEGKYYWIHLVNETFKAIPKRNVCITFGENR